MFVVHPMHISMLLLCCAPCSKAALSESQTGPEPSFSPNCRAKGREEKGYKESQKTEATQEQQKKPGEKPRSGPRGFPTVRAVCAGGTCMSRGTGFVRL